MRSAASYAPSHSQQTGSALLIVLALLVTGVLGYSLRALNHSNVRLERDKVTRQALTEAKQALIGFAATASQGPGHFVCPDDDNDGDSSGITCSASVGRLPWKTLDLTDLRDGSGERLWYAVSPNFINKVGNPVHTDTKGQIIVNGLAANEVIAVVFAPGPAINGQTRGGSDELHIQNYLEEANANSTPNEFESRVSTATFNDELLVIRAEDIFDVVEQAVRRRMGKDIGNLLIKYRERWQSALGGNGFFPRPSSFADPTQLSDLFCGDPTATEGLLPASKASSCVDAALTSNLVNASYSDSPSCDRTTAADSIMVLVCEFSYSTPASPPGSPAAQISVVFSGATRTLALPIDPASITPTATSFSQTLKDDDLQINYTVELAPSAKPKKVKIKIPLYSAPEHLEALDLVKSVWFFRNEWYRHVYYAGSEEVFAGGSGHCNGGPKCLTVVNPEGVQADKDAVLILSGMALQGRIRPSHAIADYLELENADGESPFEFRRRGRTFNDKVATVVAPAP